MLIHSRKIRALFCKIPYHLLNLNRKELPELESGDLDAEEEEEDTDGEHSVLLPPEDINLLGKVILYINRNYLAEESLFHTPLGG